MEKRFILFLTLLVLCMSFAAAVRPDINHLGYTIKEGSAQVGKTFTLQVELQNKYPEACAKSITTNIQANFPFITKMNSVYVGDICGTDIGTAEFPITVDPTATGGFYQLTVTSNYESTTLAPFSTTDVLNVYVNGTPDLEANIINSNPIDVYPGDSATLTFNIQNDGTFVAQSVNAKLAADSPIVVKWSNAYGYVGELSSQQAKTVNFNIEVPKDAPAIDYPMALTLTYNDESLGNRTKIIPVTLHVKPKAMFEVIDDGSDSIYANENSKTLRLLLKNTGTDTAEKIKIRLQPMFPFSTDGSVKYIDTLAPGATAPITLIVDTDKDGQVGKYGLDLLVDFEDKQGKSLQDTAKVSIDLKDKNILVLAYEYWYIIALVVLVVFIVRRRKSQAQEKKKK